MKALRKVWSCDTHAICWAFCLHFFVDDIIKTNVLLRIVICMKKWDKYKNNFWWALWSIIKTSWMDIVVFEKLGMYWEQWPGCHTISQLPLSALAQESILKQGESGLAPAFLIEHTPKCTVFLATSDSVLWSWDRTGLKDRETKIFHFCFEVRFNGQSKWSKSQPKGYSSVLSFLIGRHPLK